MKSVANISGLASIKRSSGIEVTAEGRSQTLKAPFAAALVANIIWGASFLASKLTLLAWEPITASTLRFAIATLAIFIGLRLSKREIQIPTAPKEILRDDEIKKLLSYARQYEPVWYYIWSFAVYTGMRNGELYALKWSDINFEDRMITVQRSYNKKFKEEKCTKTGEWRHVSICEPLWLIVQELKENHDHDIQRGACKNPGYVLPRPGLWQNGEQARKLRLFCEEIGVTPVCFHTLRACFATELLKRGVAVPSVMRVGGWTSIKTMMHYVRLSGVDDKGITAPLDYRSESPEGTNQALMNAVGDKYSGESVHEAKIIPLDSRRLPRLIGSR